MNHHDLTALAKATGVLDTSPHAQEHHRLQKEIDRTHTIGTLLTATIFGCVIATAMIWSVIL